MQCVLGTHILHKLQFQMLIDQRVVCYMYWRFLVNLSSTLRQPQFIECLNIHEQQVLRCSRWITYEHTTFIVARNTASVQLNCQLYSTVSRLAIIILYQKHFLDSELRFELYAVCVKLECIVNLDHDSAAAVELRYVPRFVRYQSCLTASALHETKSRYPKSVNQPSSFGGSYKNKTLTLSAVHYLLLNQVINYLNVNKPTKWALYCKIYHSRIE